MTREHAPEECSYRCPYCPAEYPTEMLARVHVSYADDSVHEGRNGMTPEVEPVECDASGNRVGTAFTLAGQLNLHGLSLSDIPTAYEGRTFEERERRALLVAAFNADRNRSETELRDRVAAHLTERDFEPLSVRELCDLCEHVFHPVVDDETAGPEPGTDNGPELTTAETRLRDLTALQQSIVLAHLVGPDGDRADIAAEVGTARSYPTQVIDARPDLVARLRSRLERTSPERLVADRIPDEDLAEIREEGYLDAFGIDLAAARERKRRRNSPGSPESTGGRSAGDSSLAVPGNESTATGDESPAAGESMSGERGADGSAPFSPDTDGGDSEEGEKSVGETVPRAEVEAVREQVAFDLAVVEQEMELADPTPQQVRTKAYLEQILERLDEILS